MVPTSGSQALALAEIVPLTVQKQLFDKETKEPAGHEEVTLTEDEGNRPDTTLESLSRPLFSDRVGLWRTALSGEDATRLEAALAHAGGTDAWHALCATNSLVPAAAAE